MPIVVSNRPRSPEDFSAFAFVMSTLNPKGFRQAGRNSRPTLLEVAAFKAGQISTLERTQPPSKKKWKHPTPESQIIPLMHMHSHARRRMF